LTVLKSAQNECIEAVLPEKSSGAMVWLALNRDDPAHRTAFDIRQLHKVFHEAPQERSRANLENSLGRAKHVSRGQFDIRGPSFAQLVE
jgi:hypothetical protein